MMLKITRLIVSLTVAVVCMFALAACGSEAPDAVPPPSNSQATFTQSPSPSPNEIESPTAEPSSTIQDSGISTEMPESTDSSTPQTSLPVDEMVEASSELSESDILGIWEVTEIDADNIWIFRQTSDKSKTDVGRTLEFKENGKAVILESFINYYCEAGTVLEYSFDGTDFIGEKISDYQPTEELLACAIVDGKLALTNMLGQTVRLKKFE